MNYEQQMCLCHYIRAVGRLAIAVSSFAGTNAVQEVFEAGENLYNTLDPSVRWDFEKETRKKEKEEAMLK